MNFIDFFSGTGGLSIGLESEGLELIYANDLDKNAADTYRRNLYFTNVIYKFIKMIINK